MAEADEMFAARMSLTAVIDQTAAECRTASEQFGEFAEVNAAEHPEMAEAAADVVRTLNRFVEVAAAEPARLKAKS